MIRNFIDKHHYYFKVNRNLIPIKAVGFFNGVTKGAIHSYLSIQAKSLGLTASQIGLILSIMPIAILLGPPIFGPLADKLQKHKLFLIVFMLLAAGLHTTLTAVPKIPSSALHHANSTNFTGDHHELMVKQPQNDQLHNQTFMMHMNDNSTDKRYGKENSYAGAVIETMVIYAIVRLLAQTCNAITQTFLDAVTFGLINKYGGKHNKRLGMNRFWHYVGEALGAPLAGVIIDWLKKGDGNQKEFLPAFIVNSCAAVVAAVVVASMEVTVEVKPKKVLKNVGGLFRRPPFIIFLFAVVVIGCNTAFSAGFLSLFYVEIHATAGQIGLTNTVAHLCALPLLFFSKSVIDRIGHIPLIIVSLFGYALRYIGLSMVPSIGYAYIFEAVDGLMHGLLMTAASEFGYIMTPLGMIATVQALIQISYLAIGKGIGSLVGGVAFDAIGSRQSIFAWGIANAILGIIYLLLHVFWLRKLNKPAEDIVNRTQSTESTTSIIKSTNGSTTSVI